MPTARSLLLLLVALALLTPVEAKGQETSASSDLRVSVAVVGGHTTAYRGGATYMVSALFSRASSVPFELAYEFTPSPSRGNAQLFWLGLRTPRGMPAPGFYAGTRVGLLNGPSHNGLIGDLHIGLQADWERVGVRIEPALLVGFPDQIFVLGRLAAGLSWTVL